MEHDQSKACTYTWGTYPAKSVYWAGIGITASGTYPAPPMTWPMLLLEVLGGAVEVNFMGIAVVLYGTDLW